MTSSISYNPTNNPIPVIQAQNQQKVPLLLQFQQLLFAVGNFTIFTNIVYRYINITDNTAPSEINKLCEQSIYEKCYLRL